MTEQAKNIAVQKLKLRIRIFVAVLVVAVFGIFILTSIMEYTAILAAAERQAAGYAQALASHAESAFAETDRAVKDVIHDIRHVREGHKGDEPLRERELYDLLRRVVGDAPQIGSLFLVDSTGVMFTNSVQYPPKQISVADRDYFRFYLKNPATDLLISKPVMSRLVNRWRFNLIRPLGEPDGTFCGLAVGAFEVEYFKKFFSIASLGPRGRVMLVREDGAPLVYEPYVENAYDADFRKGELFSRWLPRSSAGTYHEDSNPVEIAPRIVSYKKLSRFPVVAVVSLHRDDVLGPWKRKMILHGAITGALCIVIILLARLMLRHLDRLGYVQRGLVEQQALVKIKAAQIDAANDAIMQVDLEGRLVHFNQALCTMIGYTPAELTGKRLTDLERPRFIPGITNGFHLMKERDDVMFEAAFRAKDGREVPVEVHAHTMEVDGSSFVLCIARDVTERKKADLREQGRLAILEEMATGAALKDILSRLVVFIEQQLPGAVGSILLRDDTGERLVEGAAPSLPAFYNEAVNNLRIAEGMGSCGTAAFRKERVIVSDIDSHPFWKGFSPAREAGLKSCWSQPIVSFEGELLGTFAIYYRESRSPNTTEIAMIESAAHLASIAIGRVRGEEKRRLLEDQLRHMQRIEAIGQLAGGIAHDFNNLLTPILIYGDMLQMDLPPEAVKLKAEKIVQAAHKARELTQKLLSFGRRQMLRIEPLDLNVLIGSFYDILRRTLRENIRLETLLAPGEAVVMADRSQIEQVLLNLVVNAQDAIAANGTITIETGHVLLDDEYTRLHPGLRPGEYIILVFSDNGCGMDENTLSHIFEPFFTTKQAGHGTGLGLATVYGSVKQHDGSITVTSRVGHGTTFTIYFPATRCCLLAEEEAPGEGEDAGSGTGNATILVVEDNAMVREMISELLRISGYEVVVAEHPLEALEKAESRLDDIDLLVTDVVMPEMNGPELYEHFATRRPDLPVLYISGYTSEVSVHGGTLEEGVNFLQKPFTTEQFLQRVVEALRKE